MEHGEPALALCDDLEGWGGEGKGGYIMSCERLIKKPVRPVVGDGDPVPAAVGQAGGPFRSWF